MFIDITMGVFLGIVILVFANQIADFVAKNTRITNLFHDADNPSVYRILGILVILFAFLNPLLFSLL
jgi:hypothetical protein